MLPQTWTGPNLNDTSRSYGGAISGGIDPLAHNAGAQMRQAPSAAINPGAQGTMGGGMSLPGTQAGPQTGAVGGGSNGLIDLIKSLFGQNTGASTQPGSGSPQGPSTGNPGAGLGATSFGTGASAAPPPPQAAGADMTGMAAQLFGNLGTNQQFYSPQQSGQQSGVGALLQALMGGGPGQSGSGAAGPQQAPNQFFNSSAQPAPMPHQQAPTAAPSPTAPGGSQYSPQNPGSYINGQFHPTPTGSGGQLYGMPEAGNSGIYGRQAMPGLEWTYDANKKQFGQMSSDQWQQLLQQFSGGGGR